MEKNCQISAQGPLPLAVFNAGFPFPVKYLSRKQIHNQKLDGLRQSQIESFGPIVFKQI
jgi:hypothetical protein